jgi:hypothetical protein
MPFYQGKESGSRYGPTKDEEDLLRCLLLFGLMLETYKDTETIFNDQIIRGLHIIKEKKRIYTWVVFAVQLCVDTRRVVCKQLDRSFGEAQELRKWMSTTLEEAVRFGRNATLCEYYRVNTEMVKHNQDGLEIWLKKDAIQEVADDYLGHWAPLYRWGSFFLFRNHPMLVGLIT